MKDVKIFVKEKKKKGKKKAQDRFKSIFKEEKGKSINIIMIEIRSFLKKKNKKRLDILEIII